MSGEAIVRNIWDTVSNPGLLVSAGGVTNSLSAVTFSNSNGVSFGLNAGVVTASVSAAGSLNISAGTTSSNVTAVTFINLNGVSFGFDGSNVTATVATNYAGQGFTSTTTAGSVIVGTLSTNGLSVGVPNWITTSPSITNSSWTVSDSATSATVGRLAFTNGNGVSFALSTSNNGNQTISASIASTYAGTGFTTATTAGTNIVGTHNTAGLSMGVPAYLTTAMQSNVATISNINFSAGTTSSNLSALTFSNSNGVSFGLGTGANAGIVTATVQTNYLTTAMQSNAATISNINISAGASSANVSAVTFVNSNGVSFGYDKTNITATVATNYAGTGFTTTTTAGTAIVGTLSTNGISMGIPAYLTTSPAATSWTVSDSATSATVGRLAFTNGNGVSFALSTSNNGNQTISASIATTYAGTGFTSTTTAGVNIVGTLNTSGLSLGVPAYLTTAALSSQTLVISNSQTYYSTGTIALSEGGGAITIATSAGGQSFKFSVPQTSSIVGVAPISVSTNGSTISVLQNSTYASYFENFPMLDAQSTTLSAGVSALQVVPFILPCPVSVGFLRVPVSMSHVSTQLSGTTASSSFLANLSYTDVAVLMTQMGLGNSLSIGYLTSSSASWVFQTSFTASQATRYTVTFNVTYPTLGTTSNYTTSYAQSSASIDISSLSMTLFTGPRWVDIPLGVSLSSGNYWLAFGRSTNSATTGGIAGAITGASVGFSTIGASQNNLTIGYPGAATNSSIQLQPGLGSWSTNSAIMSTSSIGLASVSQQSSSPKAYFQMIRRA